MVNKSPRQKDVFFPDYKNDTSWQGFLRESRLRTRKRWHQDRVYTGTWWGVYRAYLAMPLCKDSRWANPGGLNYLGYLITG